MTLYTDYAGVVEEVGSKVSNGLKKGDRVAGFAHGGNEVNHEDGAFGEIIVSIKFSLHSTHTKNDRTDCQGRFTNQDSR